MKDEFLIPVIAFNIVVMVYGFYRVWTRVGGWTYASALGAIAIAVLLGAVAAGITFFVVGRMNK
jgi:hypothetical protein